MSLRDASVHDDASVEAEGTFILPRWARERSAAT